MDEEQDAAKKLLLELMEKHPNASQSELFNSSKTLQKAMKR